jgi:hypothetical protein
MVAILLLLAKHGNHTSKPTINKAINKCSINLKHKKGLWLKCSPNAKLNIARYSARENQKANA